MFDAEGTLYTFIFYFLIDAAVQHIGCCRYYIHTHTHTHTHIHTYIHTYIYIYIYIYCFFYLTLKVLCIVLYDFYMLTFQNFAV
jgi:hypothetical protein